LIAVSSTLIDDKDNPMSAGVAARSAPALAINSGSSGVAVENIRSQGLFYRITKPCRKATLGQIDSKKGRNSFVLRDTE